MTQRQWKRLEVLERFSDGDWTMKEAAKLAGVSPRHWRRLLLRYGEVGHQMVVHGNSGKKPANALTTDTVAKILELRGGLYDKFNDTHFTEKLLAVEDISVSRPTVQRLLRRHGIASPRKRRPRKYRRRRERRPQAGMMILWDGSTHDWLEGRGPHLCLMGAVDDATGKLLAGAHFVEHESSTGYLRVLREIVYHHGVPWQAYMDKHSSLRRNDDSWTQKEELAGRQEPTQVGRALETLGVEVIFANSPQAKGRVERAWGTLQDRLVSELRLAGAKTLAEANIVLERYRAEYNKRFGVAPAKYRSAWRKLPKGIDLDKACSFYTTAVVRPNNAVLYDGHMIDLPPGPNQTSLSGKTAEVRQLLSGEIRVYVQGALLKKQPGAPRKYSPQRRKVSVPRTRPTVKAAKAKLTFSAILAKRRSSTRAGNKGLSTYPQQFTKKEKSSKKERKLTAAS